MSHRSRVFALNALLILGAGCPLNAQKSAPDSGTIACRLEGANRALPRELSETSGLMASSRPGVLWTHNDKGNALALYALSPAASIIGKVRITGARFSDWEDLAGGSCTAGNCLYLADIGDNAGLRSEIAVHEVVEPAIEARSTAVLNSYRMRYPDGPQDAEALFRTPNGDLYIVSKGRTGRPINLYRYRAPYRAAELVTLDLVANVAPAPLQISGQVTGAAITPDGVWIAIRTYSELRFYRADRLLRGDAAGSISVDVSGLRQLQGEAVALTADGTVWLSSEAEAKGQLPSLGSLRCL